MRWELFFASLTLHLSHIYVIIMSSMTSSTLTLPLTLFDVGVILIVRKYRQLIRIISPVMSVLGVKKWTLMIDTEISTYSIVCVMCYLSDRQGRLLMTCSKIRYFWGCIFSWFFPLELRGMGPWYILTHSIRTLIFAKYRRCCIVIRRF